MSSKCVSPTANLLRNSRLMSMPSPLIGEFGYLQSARPRNPTHQVITTPEASRVRGDWGLKRPLPRKVSNQYLRYNDIDTMEHRTTFESAHDNVMTMKKWHEMSIPIKISISRDKSMSAFQIDGRPSDTSPAQTTSYRSEAQFPRWGFRGKALQRMSPGELKAYKANVLIPKRQEFQKFVEDQEPLAPFSPIASPAQGTNFSTTTAENVSTPLDSSTKASPPSTLLTKPANLPNFPILTVRHDGLKLPGLVKSFLDIPVTQRPLRTHPSVGMYYIYDSSYMENHPELGPLKYREFPGRIIKRTDPDRERKRYYLLGGFVRTSTTDTGNTAVEMEASYDVSLKSVMRPRHALITAEGKLDIVIDYDPSTERMAYMSLVKKTQSDHQARLHAGRNNYSNSALNLEGEANGSSGSEDGNLRDSRGRSPLNKEQMLNQFSSLLDVLTTNN